MMVVTVIGMTCYAMITWIGWLQLTCPVSSNHYTAYWIMVIELGVIVLCTFLFCVMLVCTTAALGEMNEEERNRFLAKLLGKKKAVLPPLYQAQR